MFSIVEGFRVLGFSKGVLGSRVLGFGVYL